MNSGPGPRQKHAPARAPRQWLAASGGGCSRRADRPRRVPTRRRGRRRRRRRRRRRLPRPPPPPAAATAPPTPPSTAAALFHLVGFAEPYALPRRRCGQRGPGDFARAFFWAPPAGGTSVPSARVCGCVTRLSMPWSWWPFHCPIRVAAALRLRAAVRRGLRARVFLVPVAATLHLRRPPPPHPPPRRALRVYRGAPAASLPILLPRMRHAPGRGWWGRARFCARFRFRPPPASGASVPSVRVLGCALCLSVPRSWRPFHCPIRVAARPRLRAGAAGVRARACLAPVSAAPHNPLPPPPDGRRLPRPDVLARCAVVAFISPMAEEDDVPRSAAECVSFPFVDSRVAAQAAAARVAELPPCGLPGYVVHGRQGFIHGGQVARGWASEIENARHSGAQTPACGFSRRRRAAGRRPTSTTTPSPRSPGASAHADEVCQDSRAG